MLIFYDTETSSRDILGQILSYAFLVTDTSYRVVDELVGTIRLNRTQLPEPEAIFVNGLDVGMLQQTGMPEYEAAKQVFDFLSRYTRDEPSVLVGFNSNQFDLQFIRNLMIRYGYNPYFMGRLKNKDVLHFAQYTAFANEATFPWQLAENKLGKPYYTFRLERLAGSFGLLDRPQTHDARDDVMLTIELVQALEAKFGVNLSTFSPISFQVPEDYQGQSWIGKQACLDYSDTAVLQKVTHQFWTPIISTPKEKLLLNLSRYMAKEPDVSAITCLKYVNPNKHFFRLEPASMTEEPFWETVVAHAAQDSELTALHRLDDYFKLIEKSWDIEYRIHDMGFERIDQLKRVVDRFLANPDQYEVILHELLSRRKISTDPIKDTFLITLFKRVYLNWHPNPNPEHLARYMAPRYVTGTMWRNPEDMAAFDVQLAKITTKITTETDSSLKAKWEALLGYFTHNLALSLSQVHLFEV